MNVDSPSADTDVTITIVLAVPAGFSGWRFPTLQTLTPMNRRDTSDNEDTNVTKTIDLAILKTANLTTAVAGQNLTYTLSVTNNGNEAPQPTFRSSMISQLG